MKGRAVYGLKRARGRDSGGEAGYGAQPVEGREV